MKRNKLHILIYTFILLGLCIFSFSCKDNNQTTKHLGMTPEEAKHFTTEMKEHREASIILSEFVTLKGNQYILNISKEEAKKKGITEELYEKVVKDLENSNQAITKALQGGEKFEFPDPKEMLKGLRDSIK